MNDFTLEELAALLAVFQRAGECENNLEQGLLGRLQQAHDERLELENMDFDDCLGGACKL